MYYLLFISISFLMGSVIIVVDCIHRRCGLTTRMRGEWLQGQNIHKNDKKSGQISLPPILFSPARQSWIGSMINIILVSANTFDSYESMFLVGLTSNEKSNCKILWTNLVLLSNQTAYIRSCAPTTSPSLTPTPNTHFPLLLHSFSFFLECIGCNTFTREPHHPLHSPHQRPPPPPQPPHHSYTHPQIPHNQPPSLSLPQPAPNSTNYSTCAKQHPYPTTQNVWSKVSRCIHLP